MGRAPCCEKVGLKRGKWTAEEDHILANYIAEHGEGSWRLLPKNAGLLRCGKSCRLRWINYLRPGIKRGNISREEEDVIIKLQATLGNRWSLIASHLSCRTDNEIKNYWNSHLSPQIHTCRPKYTAEPINTTTTDMSKLHSADRRHRGRTLRRSPRSATSTTKGSRKNKSKQLDPEPEPKSGDEEGASTPATAATSSPRHSDWARSTCSKEAVRPWELDTTELGDLWQDDSEIDALRSIGARHDSITQGLYEVGGEVQVDDLFDMDWDARWPIYGESWSRSAGARS